MKSLLFKNVGRLLKLTLFGILIMIILCVVMGLLAALYSFHLDSHSSDVGGLCDSSVFVFADLLFENIGIWEAFKKTYRLGFATWGGVFLIALIMGLIGGILQGINAATVCGYYCEILFRYE